MRFIEAGRDFLKNNKVIRDNQRCTRWRNQSRDWVIYFFISDVLLCSKMFWYLLHNTIYYIHMCVCYFCRDRVVLKIISIYHIQEIHMSHSYTHSHTLVHKPSWLPLFIYCIWMMQPTLIRSSFDIIIEHIWYTAIVATIRQTVCEFPPASKKNLCDLFLLRASVPRRDGGGDRESGCHSNMSYM